MSATSANTDENTRPPAIVLSDVDKTYGEGAAAATPGVGTSVSESATSNSSSIPKDGARSCAAMSAAASDMAEAAHRRCPPGKWEGGSCGKRLFPPRYGQWRISPRPRSGVWTSHFGCRGLPRKAVVWN